MRYCNKCHDCGTMLRSIDGSDWCSKCNQYCYYFSHGHQSDEVEEIEEMCPVEFDSVDERKRKAAPEIYAALIDLVNALTYETDTAVDVDRFNRLDDAITQAEDIIEEYK